MDLFRDLASAFGASAREEILYKSSLRDDLSGVWVYPSEALGETTLTVVKGHNWTCYRHHGGCVDLEKDHYDAGKILGQEGVYYFANPTNFYSPYFLVRAANGRRFLIINRGNYDKYKETGTITTSVSIWVADRFDTESPPVRPSITALGIPYYNRLETAD
jgi:hypothetical protein